jgi:hypothetical protein
MDGFIGGFLAVFFICITTVAIYVVGRVYDHKEIMAGKRTAFPASILPVEDAVNLNGHTYHYSETVEEPVNQ